MNDREKAGLRGLVSVCETDSIAFVTRESFHVDGRRAETSVKGNHSSTYRWIYDEENRQVEEIFDGLMPFHRQFLYDNRGRLKEVRISGERGERLQEAYEYNPDGSVLQTTYPELPSGCGVMEDAMLHISTDAV